MTTRDLLNDIEIAQALAPQTVQAAALDSGDIDMQKADSLAVTVAVGNIVDVLTASDRLDLKIEHADDDGTGSPAAYAACTDDEVIGFTGLTSGLFMSIDDTAKENKRHAIGYKGDKRFVKVTATPVSLITGGPIAMVAIKGHLHQKPASNS